jgi:single-stranded-DNA-specific exonuclease
MKSVWKIREKVSSDIVEQLLSNRGISKEQAKDFLSPDYDRDTHDPFLFLRMNDAVEKVFSALENEKKIIIHGDYDADGICGSMLLVDTLRHLSGSMDVKLNIEVFLPHREHDGYGVAKHNIDKFIESGASLLITVDCGIANSKELDYACESGLDVIVCDHHQLGVELPKNAIIIHPLAPGEIYPNKKLCGTGVAFKLACALLRCAQKRAIQVSAGFEKWLLDLVAIATITDVVPLLGENRALEKYGLMVLNKTRRPGLLKIIQNSNLELGRIKTDDIGFRIGPRLNAAGRLKNASTAFNALNAIDNDSAVLYSTELEVLNRERQRLSDIAFSEAMEQIKQFSEQFVYIVWSENWVPGILGLIAGKIANELKSSVFALSKSGDQFLGSGRTANGLHLVEAMRYCGDIFVKAGGHPEACGLTLGSFEMIEIFREKVNLYAKEKFVLSQGKSEVIIDAVLDISDIDFGLYLKVIQFEPFGTGNAVPLFAIKNARVASVGAVGSECKHLRMILEDGSNHIECVGFGFGKLAQDIKIGSLVDVAFKLRMNEWNGSRKLQAEVVEVIIKC